MIFGTDDRIALEYTKEEGQFVQIISTFSI